MSAWRLSRAAAADFVQIYDKGDELFGEVQAEAYSDGLERIFKFLAEFPRATRLRPEIGPTVRAYPYKAHLVIYELIPGGIRILRIRHGREDWQTR